MPELFRMYGFLFMFFSHEHEPMNVHVIRKRRGGEVFLEWGKICAGEITKCETQ